MADDTALLAALLARLTKPTADGRPDGRPLHQYRMSRETFGFVRRALKHLGARCLRTREGAAVFVAFAAEWFRRDRVGGHWEWKRPLREIGLTYGQDDPYAEIGWSQIAWAVEAGLRWWRRPPLSDGDRIIAIVRESGFPAAALRDDRRVTDWLRHAVQAIERGYEPAEAVVGESWRMNATRVVQATSDSAVELCKAIVGLRATIQSHDPASRDPIGVLDRVAPAWREELPFELERQDVAAVVETVIRAAPETSPALFATRRLRRSGDAWRATVAFATSGAVDPARLPPAVARALDGATRMRIVLRGELIGSTSVLAALEREDDDDGPAKWRARPIATDFEAPLALETEARLGAVVADDLVDEFPAYGGEALDAEVVALEPAGPGELGDTDELVVFGGSPVRSKRPWLALAVTASAMTRLTIEGERRELGVCGDRVVVAFAGLASLEALDGVRLIWRTAADRDDAPRLVVAGPTVRRLRETVYAGRPRVWLEMGDLLRECREDELRWRPVGRGRWRPLTEGSPYGRVSLAMVTRTGDLRAYVNVTVVPRDLRLSVPRTRRGVCISGLRGGRLAARAGKLLPSAVETDGVFVDLDSVDPGRTIELGVTWEAEAVVTFSNPLTPLALVSPEGRLAPRRQVLSIDRLHGYRLVAAESARICFDLRSAEGRRLSFTRRVHGEAPLIAFADDIRNLLGSSDDLDAAVRLTWTGASEWSCEIRWYDVDPGRYDVAAASSPFAASRFAMLGIAEVTAIAPAAPERGARAISIAGGADLVSRLHEALGEGPWLVFGRDGAGRVLRPRICDDGRRCETTDSAFADAVRERSTEPRLLRLAELASQPETWPIAERRRWSALLALAAGCGLPYVALDPLRVLDRHPGAAVWLLAFAETEDERRAVLALQRELPFLWSCTPLSAWISAFEARAARLEARARELELDPEFGPSMLLGAIGRIADRMPELASRLRAVLLFVFGSGARAASSASYAALADRLRRMVEAGAAQNIAGRTNLFVQRHADGPPPPNDLGLAGRTSMAQALIQRFEGFGDVVAAPVAAAREAFSPEGPDLSVLAACRAAWLFDPDHFDATACALVADWTGRGRPPETLESPR